MCSGRLSTHPRLYARVCVANSILVFVNDQQELRLKLIDFGVAHCGQSASAAHAISMDFCGSRDYMPPEIVLRLGDYDARKADIWSAGLCIFIMLFGSLPFNRQHRERLITHERRHPLPTFPVAPVTKTGAIGVAPLSIGVAPLLASPVTCTSLVKGDLSLLPRRQRPVKVSTLSTPPTTPTDCSDGPRRLGAALSAADPAAQIRHI